MSATVIAAAAAILTTAATVVVATLPEARDVLSPMFEDGSENSVAVGSLVLSLPLLAVMMLLAASGRD